MDGECYDGPFGKTALGIDRLDANGQSESWVKINRYDLSREFGEHDNVFHRAAQMNFIHEALRLAAGAGQEAHRESKQSNHRIRSQPSTKSQRGIAAMATAGTAGRQTTWEQSRRPRCPFTGRRCVWARLSPSFWLPWLFSAAPWAGLPSIPRRLPT